jgi:hypothetical protein
MKKAKILLIATSISLLFSIQSFAGWIQEDNGQWKYDQNGTLVTSQWIEDQGIWYYFDENGVMLANTTQRIDGKVYTFDVSGKWIDPNSSTEITYRTYTNTEIGYSLQVPSNVATTAFDGNSESFEITTKNMLIQFDSLTIPADADPEVYLKNFQLGFHDSAIKHASFIDVIATNLGEFPAIKDSYLDNDGSNFDLYICPAGKKMFTIVAWYTSDTQEMTQKILNTLKKLS